MGAAVFGSGDAAAKYLPQWGRLHPTTSSGPVRACPAAASGTHQPTREQRHRRAKVACSRPRLSWETGREAKKAKITSGGFDSRTWRQASEAMLVIGFLEASCPLVITR